MAGHSREATAGIDRISLIRDAANKVEEMILTEIDFAVPAGRRRDHCRKLVLIITSHHDGTHTWVSSYDRFCHEAISFVTPRRKRKKAGRR